MVFLRLLCLLALLQHTEPQRISVNADDAALAAARNNEINWSASLLTGGGSAEQPVAGRPAAFAA